MVKLPEVSGFPAFVAQRIEHLTTDQKVGGSSPSKRTRGLLETPKSLSANHGLFFLSMALVSYRDQVTSYLRSNRSFVKAGDCSKVISGANWEILWTVNSNSRYR